MSLDDVVQVLLALPALIAALAAFLKALSSSRTAVDAHARLDAFQTRWPDLVDVPPQPRRDG